MGEASYANKELQVAVDMFKAAASSTPATENLVICPFSIQCALATLLPRTSGQVRQELSSVLRLEDRSLDELLSALRKLVAEPTNIFSYRMDNISGVLIGDGSRVQQGPDYSNGVSTLLHTNFSKVPFHEEEARIREEVNWNIQQATAKQINYFFDSNEITADMKLSLYSAVSFKVQWQDPFYPHLTQSGLFTLNDGTTRECPFMVQCPCNHYYRYPDGTRTIKLKQKSNIGTVMLLLPPDGMPMVAFERSLTGQHLLDMFNEKRRMPADIQLPRFHLNTETELEPALQSMRVATLFQSDTNGGSVTTRCEVKNMFRIVQRTIIEVDETGNLDLGLTQMDCALLWFESFHANRPFLFTLWHNELQIPLLLARIADPHPTVYS